VLKPALAMATTVIAPTKLHNQTTRSSFVGGSVISFCSVLESVKRNSNTSGEPSPLG
jgi:hypothetical protein